MKKEVTFITADGQKFETEELALKHEKELQAREELKVRYTTLASGEMISKAEIIEYFNKQNCGACPFREECMNLHDTMRKYTTCTVSLCTIIRNQI